MRGLYERDKHDMPVSSVLPLGRLWHAALESPDRQRALAALEVATLLNLRRALRNGSVWIEHSLGFRSRETLFIPEPQWQQGRRAHYRRLALPGDPKDFLEPLIERAQAGVAAVAEAAGAGVLKVDDELHLTPLAAQEKDWLCPVGHIECTDMEDPRASRLRSRDGRGSRTRSRSFAPPRCPTPAARRRRRGRPDRPTLESRRASLVPKALLAYRLNSGRFPPWSVEQEDLECAGKRDDLTRKEI